MHESLDSNRLLRTGAVGIGAAIVGLVLAEVGLGGWGFVIAGALSALCVGFVVDLGPAEQQATPDTEPHEIAPPAVETPEVAPPTDEQKRMRERTRRFWKPAGAAEWVASYLELHGPTTHDELSRAAAQVDIDEATLATAMTDVGVVHDPSDSEFRALDLPHGRRTSVGESLVGEGNEVAHVDLLIGSKRGPVGKAFARALVNQREGHTNLVAVVTPNLPCKPNTIISNKVAIKGATQAAQMFGPAQAAVARAVVDSVREGVIPEYDVDDLCLIVGVFIHSEAADDKKIFDYNYQATKEAIARGLSNEPSVSTIFDSPDEASSEAPRAVQDARAAARRRRLAAQAVTVAAEAKARAIAAEPPATELRGPYSCAQCGYEVDVPKEPCPSCGHFRWIPQAEGSSFPASSDRPDRPADPRPGVVGQRWRAPSDEEFSSEVAGAAAGDVSSGTYSCTQCGYELDVGSTMHLPPCPSCGNSEWETHHEQDPWGAGDRRRDSKRID